MFYQVRKKETFCGKLSFYSFGYSPNGFEWITKQFEGVLVDSYLRTGCVRVNVQMVCGLPVRNSLRLVTCHFSFSLSH